MKIQKLKNKVSEIKTSLDVTNHKTGQKKVSELAQDMGDVPETDQYKNYSI